MSSSTEKKIIIAGGGTGGHIYPAVAMARALQKRDPQLQVHFVGTQQGLETRIIPKEGWPLHTLEVGKLNYSGSWHKKIWTLMKIPWALVQSAALLFELKPQAVLGVGGYASGPFVLMSTLLGFRTSLWEPNAVPGMTNRWLSRFVRRSYVVFEEARHFLKSKKTETVGLPVREALENLISSQRSDSDFHVLIFGGSQGARAINKVVTEALSNPHSSWQGFRFLHQTGVHDFPQTQELCQKLNFVEVREYLHDIEKNYDWADLIVCRAGASTVAEIAACGKAAIFIPLPSAADDHQYKNAKALADVGAADLILQKDFNPEVFRAKIEDYKNHREKLKNFEKKIREFYRPQAAQRMAELLLGQLGE